MAHITYMADIGYGYKSSIQYMARDYSTSLGKEPMRKKLEETECLSNC